MLEFNASTGVNHVRNVYYWISAVQGMYKSKNNQSSESLPDLGIMGDIITRNTEFGKE